jgi:hypothetical protein
LHELARLLRRDLENSAEIDARGRMGDRASAASALTKGDDTATAASSSSVISGLRRMSLSFDEERFFASQPAPDKQDVDEFKKVHQHPS